MANRNKRQHHHAATHPRKTLKQWLIPIIGLVILVTLGGVVYAQQQADNGTLPQTVSVDEAVDMQNEGAFILDVREPSEWAEYHIEGATLIPLGELSSRLDELPADQEIVIVCRSGNRSATARDILRDAGYENSTSMDGGMLAWRSAGYPTE